MGLRINQNIPALNASRQAGNSSRALGRSLNALSSGLRINRAADDAAGLAISERFRSQVRQYTVEANNLQSGVNAIQTAEGGLSTQQDAIQRIRELAVQASNGTLSDDNRAALNQEAQQLMEQINTTAEGTQFNGTQLLNGDGTPVSLGTQAGNEFTVAQSTTTTLGLNGVDLSTAAGATAALDQLDAASTQVGQNRATLGAQQNRLEQGIASREMTAQNLQASESAIRDLDIARATTEQVRNQILLQSSVAALAQGNVIPADRRPIAGRIGSIAT